jgi:hypothetical protein
MSEATMGELARGARASAWRLFSSGSRPLISTDPPAMRLFPIPLREGNPEAVQSFVENSRASRFASKRKSAANKQSASPKAPPLATQGDTA